MNLTRPHLRVVLFSFACVLVSSCVCHAQLRVDDNAAARPSGSRTEVAIRKLVGTGRDAIVLTPRYDVSVPGGSRELREWGRVRVEYATRPEWMDDLVIRFYAIGAVREQGRNLYSLYRKEVRYMDIEGGSDHMAEVFIRPSAIKRYGDIIAAAVEFVVDGNVVAQEVDPRRSSGLPEEWWKDPRVVKSDALTIRDTHILNRKESPFAYCNIQDFEAIR